MMNWKRFGRNRQWYNLPEPTEEATKKLSQDSRYVGRDSNRAHPEYKSRMPSIDQPIQQ
jgi:hypothetical protein